MANIVNSADGAEVTAATENWVCAEITYASGEYGDNVCDVHSDICPPGHTKSGLNDIAYREFLHQCLDEWLNKSSGTGYFVVGNPEEWQRVEADET